MNHPSDEMLQRELESITSASSQCDLSGETAKLREGWSVLARSLESPKFKPEFDEAAFAAKLRRELLPDSRVTPRSAGGNRSYALTLVAATLAGGTLAIALIALVAVAVNRFSVGSNDVVDKNLPNHQAVPSAAGGVSDPSELAANPSTHENSTSPPEPESAPASWGWSDPLDDEITVASAQIQQLQQRTPRLDQSLSTLDRQMRELSADLQDGAL